MTTYAPGSQVLSDDLNEWQGEIYDEKGDIFPFAGGFDGTTPGWTKVVTGAPFVRTTTNGAELWLPLKVRTGRRIKSVQFRVKPNGASNAIQCRVYSMNSSASESFTSGDSTTGTAWETVTIDINPDTIAVSGTTWFARILGNGTNQKDALYAEVRYDVPRPS